MPKVATQDTFDSLIQSDKAVLVDFHATWCGPCKMMAPVIGMVEKELSDQLEVITVDVDENPQLAQKFGVMGIPNLVVLKDGETVKQLVGYQDRAKLLDELQPVL